MRHAASATALFLLITASGCASAPEDAEIYRHEWAWGGPNYNPRVDDQGEPLFLDNFESDADGNWTMTVTSNVTAGNFTIHLRAPDGRVRVIAQEDGAYRFDGAEGEWGVEILTDEDERGRPQGSLELVVRG